VIELGGWVLGTRPLHVSVHDNAARLRTQGNRHKLLNVAAPRGVILHWDDRAIDQRGTASVVGLADVLHRVILDEDFETAVAALDWALHTSVLDMIDFETIILGLPAERRGIADWVDPECESLPESLARTRLRLSGHKVTSQIPLMEAQRIDLVVDQQVGIEVDGERFHLTTFESDRQKDVDIAISGLHNLRPSAKMVFHDWGHFALGVDAALAARGWVIENSGVPSRDVFRSRGMTGWRRRPPRGTPENSKLYRRTALGARARGGLP
jgi:very-short-patch-repair endonuclease